MDSLISPLPSQSRRTRAASPFAESGFRYPEPFAHLADGRRHRDHADNQLDDIFREFRQAFPESFDIILRPFGGESYWIRSPADEEDLRSGLTSLAARLSAWFTSGVFIGTETRLEVGFSTAQARLASLVCGGLLEDACHEAYDTWTTGLARVGPFGAAPGVSRLVQVHIRTLAQQEDSARWAMRWQATGATGTLFPALDADLKLTPAQETPRPWRCPGSTGRRSAAWAPGWTGWS